MVKLTLTSSAGWILIPLLAMVFTGNAAAQTKTQNYVHTFDVQVAGIIDPLNLTISTPASTAIQTIQYFDGLGRPIQTVQKGITPDGFDLIKPVKYNHVGLDETNYEPYAVTGTSTGNYMGDFETAQPAFYLNLFNPDNNGKSPVEYEKSPLNRVLKQGAPGSSWQLDMSQGGHPVQFSYLSNNSSDPKLKATLWSVSGNTCTKGADYANNQLYVTRIIGEDLAETYEFKDKQGQVVLKRAVLSATTHADTYYVYDDFGLLRFVISPEGSLQITGSFNSTTPLAQKYVYCYTYDARKRLIEKQVPGKAPEYYIYDKTDKVVLYQDGNMRKTGIGGLAFNEWMFSKYDALGRVIMTGITTQFPNQTRDALQTLSNGNAYKCWEFISYAGTARPADNNYYSNQAFPTYSSTNCTIHTLNYYDKYNVYLSGTTSPVSIANSSTLNLTLPATPDYQSDQVYVAGKPTVNYTRYNSMMLVSATYYDIYGRVIQTCAKNHSGTEGYDRYTNLYKGLTSQILSTEHKNYVYSIPYLTLNERTEYTYDAAGRPLTYTYTYNNTGPARKITYTYTTLGQVKSKLINDDATPMQTVDYKYNIRGWLSKINDPAALNGDLFGMELMYNTQSSNPQNTILQFTPCFNGNISGAIWQTALPYGNSVPGITGQKSYNYNYDKLNRLLKSNYAEVNGASWSINDKYTELIANGSTATGYRPYDLNGNIQTMKRQGLNPFNAAQITIDNLTYSYDGNKLLGVDNAVSMENGGNFLDNGNNYGSTHTAEYAYDANGNLIKDLNKGIILISYNYLNQPLSVVKTGGNLVEYTYDAAGNKRSQQYIYNGTLSKTTTFYNNFVYENGYPAWVTYDEGRVVLNNNGMAYCNEAYIKDHLGNVRVAYYLQAGTLRTRQVNSYYPFGMNIKGLTANSTDNFKPNEYLYNGKMMQDEMGLGWLDYGARFYDAVLGRFHSMDPLSEDRNWTSPFTYCQNNPISRIDVDGMLDTDFGIDKDGYIKQIGPTNNEPDKLYATNDKGEKTDTNGDKKVDDKDAVTVTDKSILPELSKEGTTINKATTTNSNDAANIFIFAADHSEVEWTVVRYSGNKGGDNFMIGTWHSPEWSPGSDLLGIPESSVESSIHSHPGIATDYTSERQSMGIAAYGQADGDLGRSNQRYQNNGMREPYHSYVYFPNSGNTWKVGSGANTKVKKSITTHK